MGKSARIGVMHCFLQTGGFSMRTRKPRLPVIPLLVLSGALLFLSLTGLMGGILLLQDPSGALMQMDTSALARTPFQNYTIPGLLLLIVYGLGGLIALATLWLRPQSKPLMSLTRWTHEHWAWDLTFALGVFLLVWLVVQLFVLPATTPIQAVMFVIALILTGVSLLPRVREYYRI
jgi:hypothetical protein